VAKEIATKGIANQDICMLMKKEPASSRNLAARMNIRSFLSPVNFLTMETGIMLSA
jgi:hypothetical protein